MDRGQMISLFESQHQGKCWVPGLLEASAIHKRRGGASLSEFLKKIPPVIRSRLPRTDYEFRVNLQEDLYKIYFDLKK